MSSAAPQFAIRPNERVVFKVAYEDRDVILIDKPVGLVVQPGKGHAQDSLLNGLFARGEGTYGNLLHNLGVRRDFGLLHRLDKDTSGLVLVAKMPNAYDQLRRDFEERKIDKEYLCLVAGVPSPRQGVVQARLKEVVADMKKSIISRQGQEAISAYDVLAATADGAASLVRMRIKTGRLHQIRAHMLFLNTPVLGDDLYGVAAGSGTVVPRAPKTKGATPLPPAPRLCLHAARLGFKHPTTGKWQHVESPLPPDLAAYLRKLGLAPPG